MLSRSVEDYLKTVYALSRDGKETVSTKEISEHLGIAPASVTEMLKKLASEGYVEYSPYRGAVLTGEGLRIARKMTRKHRLLERFLYDILKIGKDSVHEQACEMEHTVSDKAEESICRLLDNRGKCPDDSKSIPPCDLLFSTCEECIRTHKMGLEEVGRRKEDLVPISSLKEGYSGKVMFIRGNRRLLRRLLDMGITPGTTIHIMRVAPFGGAIELEVRGSRLALGHDIASNVFIEAPRPS